MPFCRAPLFALFLGIFALFCALWAAFPFFCTMLAHLASLLGVGFSTPGQIRKIKRADGRPAPQRSGPPLSRLLKAAAC